MWRTPIAAVVSLLLLHCGSGRRDWRIPPCAGESEATCRVDRLVVEGTPRSYLVSHAPGKLCPEGPLPVVFAWHGSGGNGAQLRSYLGLEGEVAGRALMVYPDGLPRRDTGGFTGWSREPEGDDVAFFDAMLLALGALPCVDTNRVFGVGHSRGGRFVEVLACQRAKAHKALAMIAAGAWNLRTCPGRAPLWISHGRKDEVVGFWQAKLLRRTWARRNRCSPVSWFRRFEDGHCSILPGCPRATPVVWCPHSEMLWQGHGVPSFAAGEIWRFFQQFEARRPEVGSGPLEG